MPMDGKFCSTSSWARATQRWTDLTNITTCTTQQQSLSYCQHSYTPLVHPFLKNIKTSACLSERLAASETFFPIPVTFRCVIMRKHSSHHMWDLQLECWHLSCNIWHFCMKNDRAFCGAWIRSVRYLPGKQWGESVRCPMGEIKWWWTVGCRLNSGGRRGIVLQGGAALLYNIS